MGIYVENTFDYSADPAIQTQYKSALAVIQANYAEYMTDEYSHVPDIPTPPGYPPENGVYTSIRTWTDYTQAQAFVADVQAMLTANPSYTAYSVGPVRALQT